MPTKKRKAHENNLTEPLQNGGDSHHYYPNQQTNGYISKTKNHSPKSTDTPLSAISLTSEEAHNVSSYPNLDKKNQTGTFRRQSSKQQQHSSKKSSSNNSNNQQPSYHKHSPSLTSSKSEKSKYSKGDKKSTSSTTLLSSKEILLTKRKSQQEMLRLELSKLVLWRQPMLTMQYCIYELFYLIRYYLTKLISFKKTLIFLTILFIILISTYYTEGRHQKTISQIETILLWSLYWLGLGIMSSVGLGTGLHTFLLYLGPFIAQVTIAAYECGSIKFPRPPYPNEIVCPTTTLTPPIASSENSTMFSSMISDTSSDLASLLLDTSSTLMNGPISFWKILWKVKLEAFLWGLGTALGELPPYFVARTARARNLDTDDNPELLEFEQLLLNAELNNSRNLSLFERMRYIVFRLIKRIGFLGILLCASIPNPLFDLAGITCGYFLIPFWTFFTATVLGKALIKMSIQTIFIIFLFSEHHMERIIKIMKQIPYYGRSLQAPFKEWLIVQKKKMHRKPGEPINISKASVLSRIFNIIVIVMICFFIVSIINSLAQKYYKRTRSYLKIM
ncbi:unnamed protein product [Didymodactylos carnosus]|uniref:Uncharacterized protein n=1 Tax=Didymodactylos carnosus TaxID=1234261 RepID=A0A814F1R8_9BILA|nr:unnamed protein product [Didymodactylos carnosus]CAF1161378.1 unnamed protein product [Didymodactylos carnosus]CAF3748355.1 unnamed protein product [Didymodactylos carnosus]CAF3973136.1 unnamed protein product [Didymodactylos carnosus]